MIVDPQGQSLQQRGLAVIAAAHDQRHAGADPETAQRSGVGRLQLDRQRRGHPQRQCRREGARVGAAAPRQNAVLGQERNQLPLVELGPQGHLILHDLYVGAQRVEVQPSDHAAQRRIQAPGQEVGRGAAKNPPARRRQTGAQAHPGVPFRVDRDAGTVQHLLSSSGDLQQAAPAAAGAACRPAQRRVQHPLQKVSRRAACAAASPGPGRQPQHGGREVDPQPARRGERIALDMLEGQRAARQRVAVAAQIAVVPVWPPVDPEQVAHQRIAHADLRA